MGQHTQRRRSIFGHADGRWYLLLFSSPLWRCCQRRMLLSLIASSANASRYCAGAIAIFTCDDFRLLATRVAPVIPLHR